MNDKPDAEDIGCMEALEGLYAYLDGELEDEGAKAAIEHHLSHCRVCYSRIELEKLLSNRIRESAQSQAPDTLRDRLRDVLDKL